MKALVFTHVGLEDVSASEISKIISASDVSISKGKVFFSCNGEQDLVDLCYHGRTFSKVVLLLSEFEVSGMPKTDILKGLESFIGKSAVVRCDRFGEHSFTSFEVEQEFNRALASLYSVEINHKRPASIFFLLIENNKGFFGVDFSGIDLGRRDYRIFLGTSSLKGDVAAGLLFVSGFESKHSLLDPFCRQGIVPIEAALMSTNTSPHKFGKEKFGFAGLPDRDFVFKDSEKDFKGTIIAMDDNFKHVSSAKKNAKIAGIVKSVEFSRTDLQWLDAKFGRNFIDRIVSFPIQVGRVTPEPFVAKLYHQFFYQAEFILKKSGKVCVIMRRGVDLLKQNAAEFKFKVEHERKIMQGSEELTIILFSR